MSNPYIKDLIVRIETGLPFDKAKLLELLTEIDDAGGLDSIRDCSFEQGYDEGYENGQSDADFENES